MVLIDVIAVRKVPVAQDPEAVWGGNTRIEIPKALSSHHLDATAAPRDEQ